MRKLLLLTNSSLTTFRRCPREYYFRYVLNRKGRRKAAALRFGSLFHVGLNAWWASFLDKFFDALLAVRASAEKDETDPFDLVKAEVLLAGYTARWGDEGYSAVWVEKSFRTQVDMAADVLGSIDAIATKDGHVYNVEHKTTSADISAGSDYWRHVVALDSQVSTYDAASRAMGYDIAGTLYDVIRKPELEPWKATPEEKRKYTKPTKKDPVPRLYSNQRETDETLDEYRDRLAEDIVARPDWYFQRQLIVRLERDNEEHARDVAQTAEMIRFAEERDAWPRSTGACKRYGSYCEYAPVCSGETTIDDDVRYETKTKQHEELNEESTQG